MVNKYNNMHNGQKRDCVADGAGSVISLIRTDTRRKVVKYYLISSTIHCCRIAASAYRILAFSMFFVRRHLQQKFKNVHRIF